MNEFQPHSRDPEPLSRLVRVDRICDQFEQQWREGELPRIEDFLGRTQSEDREALLRQLVNLELQLLNEAGQPVDRQDYQGRFAGEQAVVDSAFDSFQQRHRDDQSLHSTEPMAGIDDSVPAPQGPEAVAAEVPSSIGRYQILRVLGQGGFATVYLARDTDLDREVALKVPRLDRFGSEAALDFFVEEARKSAALDHPGIVRIHDVQREPDRVYIVQQYLSGGDLAGHIKRQRLPHRRIAELMIAIAEAVGYAHQRRYIHLDLKPANILLDQAGKPYVADFGLALHESKQPEMRGEVLGTYVYMSPAQVRGETHRLDGRADIWSLGVILYELLTGQRPFRGETREELIDQIEHHDPRPPRQVNPEVPRELSRICLACLTKRATERYEATANLIDDLQHWLSGESEKPVTTTGAKQSVSPATAESPGPKRIIPQGLRSFGPEHADFYLELLPGPHDRDGLPVRIRFWKSQIEKSDLDETFSIGVVYGPSGCGKSSLIKAGLLPRLGEDVLPIYVEATAADTEVRLIKALRRKCPSLPEVADLPEMIAQLRESSGSQGRKVLMVLDQFEQWLHAHESRDDSQLIPALRQCDGVGIQCIVMVRDDFWMSLTRFMQALEVPLVEGHNSAAVDLFDTKHAHKVLAAFGRAYDRYPDPPPSPDAPESRFLLQAVEGLADEGKVICVRLAVFAEMMKGRPWTEESLAEVGGTDGVGVTFLEETFSAKTAPPTHRLHQQAVRAVLRSLLPERGSDIKGQMKSYDELLAVSGYEDRRADFDALLGILDGEVRLITPTEPDQGTDDGSQPSTTQSQSRSPHARYFQLTHDFLVPSLREWLTRKQRETRRGRAELRLAERAALWNAKPENRHLPSVLEWLNIRGLTTRKNWSESQRKMMAKAGRLHGVRALLTVVAAMILGLTGYGAYGWNQGKSAVKTLLAADPQSVLDAADMASAYRYWTADELRRIAAGNTGTREEQRRQRHARLALLPFDSEQVGPLLDDGLTTSDTAYVGVIRQALLQANAAIEDDCWSRLRNGDLSATERFRAGVMLAGLAPQSDQWNETDFRLLVDELAALNSVYQPQFWPLLQGVGDRLLPPLELLFSDEGRPESEQLAAANAIAFFAEHDAQRLARLLLIASGPQYNILYDTYKEVADAATQAHFAASIQQQPTENMEAADRIALGKERATSAITLLRLGERHSILDVLRYESDPESLTQFVHRCRARGVTPNQLLELLEQVDQRRGPLDGARQKLDDSVMYALLLALGEFAWDELPPARETLVQRLALIYENDPSSGVHSATGWLLRQWGHNEAVAKIDQTALPYDESGHREWYVQEIEYESGGLGGVFTQKKNMYLTFIVFRPREFTMGSPANEPNHQSDETQHQVTLTRPIAVCDRELTWAQWDAFEGPRNRQSFGQQFSKTLGDFDPVFGQDWFEAVTYCRWLTERSGLSEEAQCYADPSSLAKDGEGNPTAWPLRLDRAGFRLPTEAEWESICRSGTGTAYSFGHDEQLLDRYAWSLKNSGDWSHTTGELRPNPRGLFDIHGNLSEWCHDWDNEGEWSDATDPMGAEAGRSRVNRGGSWSGTARYCRSSDRIRNDPTRRSSTLGFRLATVPRSQGPDAQEKVSGAESAGR